LIGVGKRNAAADADVFCGVLLEEVADDPDETAEHEPEDDAARGSELREKSLRAKRAEGERGHHAEFTDGEEGDEAERVHAREIRFAIGDVHGAPENAGAESGEDAVRGILSGRVRAGRSDGENGGADAHDERAAEDAEPTGEAGAAKLIEKKKTPKDAEERIGIPERKRDAEADIANGVHGERVGDGPKATGENGPNYEMRSAASVGADRAGAEDEGGKTPSREKDADDHDERDDHWRKAERDEFGGSFGGAEPGSGGEAGENAEELERAGAGRLRRLKGWRSGHF